MPKKNGSFFSQLRRRKVLQAAAIYGAVAWGVTEVVVTVVDQLFLPQWVSTLAVIFFVVGFPVAMFLAWTFDFTAEGIRRTEIRTKRGTASIIASLVLLVVGTAGLFFLIKPSLDIAEEGRAGTVSFEPNSIAVMPFANASARPEDAYLVGGLSDELRDQLARTPGLRIAARSSSVVAMEEGLDALAASARLGVANIVEGSLRRQGNILTVSVQLIDGRDGLTNWSRQFQRGPQEVLNVQQAIAEAVVGEVLPNVEVAVADVATRDPTANEFMLKARQLEQQVRERTEVDRAVLLEAVRLYRKATEADPNSALAHSRLAGALLFLGDIDAAVAPVNKALTLAPNDSEVQVTLGELRWAQGMVDEARIAWQSAVDLNASNPEALASLAMGNYYKGEIDLVAGLFRRALELDPLNLERYGALGNFLAFECLFDEANELIESMTALPGTVALYRAIANLREQLGDIDKAIAWTIRARDVEPDNPTHRWKLAEYYADIGEFDIARSLDPNGIGVMFKMRRFEEAIELAEFAMIDEPENIRIRATLATAHIALDQHESAIHVLEDTGLPGSVFEGGRSSAEFEGYVVLQNALYAIGETEMAQDLARFSVEEVRHSQSFIWWITVGAACDYAILGMDDEVRTFLQRAQKGRQLVWDPWLKDMPCFRRFQGDPVYQETVRYFDELRATLRNRLPETLEAFGVTL
ncbi:MAG: tetratricopeptide repeat protein [Xanthomonadales bacterium]|nr:tetratricopeptide repeat protein [Xanthomonadales bacterium]